MGSSPSQNCGAEAGPEWEEITPCLSPPMSHLLGPPIGQTQLKSTGQGNQGNGLQKGKDPLECRAGQRRSWVGWGGVGWGQQRISRQISPRLTASPMPPWRSGGPGLDRRSPPPGLIAGCRTERPYLPDRGSQSQPCSGPCSLLGQLPTRPRNSQLLCVAEPRGAI